MIALAGMRPFQVAIEDSDVAAFAVRGDHYLVRIGARSFARVDSIPRRDEQRQRLEVGRILESGLDQIRRSCQQPLVARLFPI